MFTFTLQAQSIQFISDAKSWNEVLLKAKAANKKVFVDVYTTWCGPCKWMDAEVFNKKEVADYYNSTFINVKVDAEKGWGTAFAKTEGVDAYPTYLFFDQNGKVIYNAKGSMPVSKFLMEGKTAAVQSYNEEDVQKRMKLASGKYDADFLYSYLTSIPFDKRPQDIEQLIEKYLSLVPEDSLGSQKVNRIIKINAPVILDENSLTFKAFLKQYRQYPFKLGFIDGTWMTLRSKLKTDLAQAGKSRNDQQLEKLIHLNSFFENDGYAKEREANYFRCMYYAFANDSIGLSKAFKRFCSDAYSGLDTAKLYAEEKATLTKMQDLSKTVFPGLNSEQVKKTFQSESIRTYSEFCEIISSCQQYKLLTKDIRESIKLWIQKSIDSYRGNPISVNSYFEKLGEDIKKI
ncbi:thioredoxin-like protein [Pedobacter metabolipauper]|uniref:Thioredoxin-like protein n=2 Tax=Pedobacter metabolipauper TaxID=425513 RepID=A0A4R6SRX8_9SPHI|nr:thioredoxin-like protein [Pedobacter metabolipauper]